MGFPTERRLLEALLEPVPGLLPPQASPGGAFSAAELFPGAQAGAEPPMRCSAGTCRDCYTKSLYWVISVTYVPPTELHAAGVPGEWGRERRYGCSFPGDQKSF